MIKQHQIINLIKKLAAENAGIEVLWLYGSRAKDTADENSDYDLAIAYSQIDGEHTGKEYHTDELAYQWSKNTHVDISVIDINQVPVPLAYTVISDGKVIVCKNDFRLHSEESRIWSMWEAYSYEHAKNHQ